MDDSVPHGLWRMDWGFGNPNKTATLIALLLLAGWGLAYFRKWGFWTALTLFAGFGACLILTQSRGGLVGMLAGCLVLLAWAPRPFPWRRSLAVAVTCIGLAIFASEINAESRYTKGLSGKDLSIENRLLLWDQVPAMIHDAPNGWGLGKSGDAYMQWYQPITRGEGYRTLVNSHLTWLTELNGWGRIAYAISWTAVFVLLWPDSNHRWYSNPFALRMAFAICASFSSVAEAPTLWIIPLTALIRALIARFEEKAWPRPGHWIGATLGSLVMFAGLFLFVTWSISPSSIYCPRAGIVTLGSRSPKIWIVAPNKNVLGEHYGHEVRRGFNAEPIFKQTGLGITSGFKDVPQNETLVFSGIVPSTFAASNPARIILINPEPISPDLIQALGRLHTVTVIMGEYSRNKNYWSEQASSHSNIKLQIIEGSEEYLSNWMHDLADAIKS